MSLCAKLDAFLVANGGKLPSARTKYKKVKFIHKYFEIEWRKNKLKLLHVLLCLKISILQALQARSLYI